MYLCTNCHKDTENPRFCCRSCAAIFNNKNFPKRKKIKKKCKKCESTIYKSGSRFCKIHADEYKNRSIQIESKTIGEYRNKESIKELHVSSKHVHVRGLARNKYKFLVNQPCKNCGYDKHVELCHIKPVRDFDDNALISEVNHINNIIQLCPNCHWEFDNNILDITSLLGIRTLDSNPQH
jgi:hypothetical protein